MTHRSPLVTLAGLVVAFAAMFGVNLASSAPPGDYGQPRASASAAAPASTEPTPTVTASDEPTTTSMSPTPTTTPTKTEGDDQSEFPDQVVYAGRTHDDSAAIAVAVLGDRAAAYLCDGRNVEAWMTGTVDGDEIELEAKDGTTLKAELDGRRLEGRLDRKGERLRFAIRTAEKPAGLYRAKGSKTTIGWIVLPDGSQVGIQSSDGQASAAPKLDPEEPVVEAGGERLDAAPVTGDLDI